MFTTAFLFICSLQLPHPVPHHPTPISLACVHAAHPMPQVPKYCAPYDIGFLVYSFLARASHMLMSPAPSILAPLYSRLSRLLMICPATGHPFPQGLFSALASPLPPLLRAGPGCRNSLPAVLATCVASSPPSQGRGSWGRGPDSVLLQAQFCLQDMA